MMPMPKVGKTPKATRNGKTSLGKTICFTRLALPEITVGPRPSASCTAIHGANPASMNTANPTELVLPGNRPWNRTRKAKT